MCMYGHMCVHTRSGAAPQELPIWFLKQSLISLGPTNYSRLAGSHRYLLTSTSTGMVSAPPQPAFLHGSQ